jgi:TRAP-type C4-dicarboxylate transport system permease small subunit
LKNKKFLNGLELTIKVAIVVALLSMVILVFLNAVMRYLFNSGIPESEELARYFFIWTVFLGSILAFKNNLHMGVTLVVDKLSGLPRKVFVTIADILSLFAVYIIFRGGITFTQTVAGTKSPSTGLPLTGYTVAIVFASVCIGLIIIYRIFYRWTTNEREEN